jgi:hypothetical protein
MEVKKVKTYNFTRGMIELVKGLFMIPRKETGEDPDDLESRVIQGLFRVHNSGNEAYVVYNDFIQKYGAKHETIPSLLTKKQYYAYKVERSEVFRRYANINYHTRVEAKK